MRASRWSRSAEASRWRVDCCLAADATKAELAHLLRQEDSVALLFTASHGMGFPRGDPRQLAHQGALLCQDWPGPRIWGRDPVPESYYYAADDLDSDFAQCILDAADRNLVAGNGLGGKEEQVALRQLVTQIPAAAQRCRLLL